MTIVHKHNNISKAQKQKSKLSAKKLSNSPKLHWHIKNAIACETSTKTPNTCTILSIVKVF